MFRFFDLLLFTIERLRKHYVLVFWALVGLSTATTLALSLWLYVDAVNTGLLTSSLSNPPYAFRFRYLGAWNGNITDADVNSATAAVQNTFTGIIGLPSAREVNFARGGAWAVKRLPKNQSLGNLSLATLNGTEDQMEIFQGEWPPKPVAETDPIPVLIPETMLYKMGVQFGDKLTVTPPGGKPITLQIAALWRPLNANDPGWVFPTKFFDTMLIVQQADFLKSLTGVKNPIEEAAWFVAFDGSSVKTSDVNGLLGRIVDGQRAVTSALPPIRLDLSPVDGLNAFNIQVNKLTQQLVIMILPVGGLIFYFVTLVAGLLVSRQLNEDVTLRSRGMSRQSILSIHLMTWLLMAFIALGVAIGVSPYLVKLIGQTSSFMRFDNLSGALYVTPTQQSIIIGALTGLIAASSGLFIAWRSTGETITSFKRNAARAKGAWWQRAYLDVILLVPGCYVLLTLKLQGGLQTAVEDPFSNPLNFLGPTLFSLGLTLLFLRLWPIFIGIGSRLMSYTTNIALLMALRELTRSIGRYRNTLLMMCFTLSLTGYTASMASTIDKTLQDTVDYKIGADAVLVVASDAQTDDSSSAQGSVTVTGYNTLPADDLIRVEGVGEVSRVGRYPARLVFANQRVEGTILGIDRATIPAIARFRTDYAAEDWGSLFNRLAADRTGVIINSQAATKNNLKVGQIITVQVSALNTWYEMKVPIVGLVNYFPTLDPTSGFFLIGNLDPIFETVGTELPSNFWISLKPNADLNTVRTETAKLGYPILTWLDPTTSLLAAQASPSRRGVLGFLSVGFVATILLTLVGSIVQSAASFSAQAVQLGSLRAMGLGSLSVAIYLIFVQGIAAASGILSGTSIGLATTLLFLPLLDFSNGLPPYLVRVDWANIALVYGMFSLVLLIVTLVTTVLMSRERLSTVVKLGDA